MFILVQNLTIGQRKKLWNALSREEGIVDYSHPFYASRGVWQLTVHILGTATVNIGLIKSTLPKSSYIELGAKNDTNDR